ESIRLIRERNHRICNVHSSDGGRTRTRTWDPLIKSQLLYQLSYAPEMPPRGPARAASCSKASSHCPGKARRDVCNLLGGAQSSVHSRESGNPDQRLAPRFRGDERRGNLEAPPIKLRRYSALRARRPRISQPRDVSSTNGKPPGGDPAAPVRRRSCRGAGSATAGARLGMW